MHPETYPTKINVKTCEEIRKSKIKLVELKSNHIPRLLQSEITRYLELQKARTGEQRKA